MKILIINGPNLNLLGKRDPELYGYSTFEDYLTRLRSDFPEVTIDYFQSNLEGEIINALQDAEKSGYDAVLLNAGGYTHTSVSIADAVAAIGVPVTEVHVTQILSREEYRHISLIAPHSTGSVIGFGLESYRIALLGVLNKN